MRLCKYKKIENKSQLDQVLSMVQDSCLWLSSKADLNDPLEGFYIGQSYSDDNHDQLVDATVKRNQMIFGAGVCSLSDSNDDLLMWCHYGGSLAGVKMIIDTSLDSDLYKNSAPVQYSTRAPLAAPTLSFDILYTKHISWAYEREWRIVRPDSAGTEMPVKAGAIAELHIGCKLTDDFKEQLFNCTKGTKTRPFGTKLISENFKVESLEFNKDQSFSDQALLCTPNPVLSQI